MAHCVLLFEVQGRGRRDNYKIIYREKSNPYKDHFYILVVMASDSDSICSFSLSHLSLEDSLGGYRKRIERKFLVELFDIGFCDLYSVHVHMGVLLELKLKIECSICKRSSLECVKHYDSIRIDSKLVFYGKDETAEATFVVLNPRLIIKILFGKEFKELKSDSQFKRYMEMFGEFNFSITDRSNEEPLALAALEEVRSISKNRKFIVKVQLIKRADCNQSIKKKFSIKGVSYSTSGYDKLYLKVKGVESYSVIREIDRIIHKLNMMNDQ